MRRMRIGAVLVVFTLVCACGGKRSSVFAPPQAPLPIVQQTLSPSTPQTVSVAFHIAIPRAAQGARRAQYVSAATQSASIGVGDASATVNCTTSCDGTVDAPVGNDTFVVKLFDTQNGSGNLLSTGSATQTIVFDAANVVNLTFDGVVASVRVTISPTSIVPGTAGSASVIVDALDADGNVIVGPGRYVDALGNPLAIALSDSDTSGASSLSQASVTEPTTGITLNYTAALANEPTVTASAPGFSSQSATLTLTKPTLASISAVSGLIGTSVTETLTGTNFPANASVNVSGNGIEVGQVSVTNATTMQATFFIDPQASLTDRNVTVSAGSVSSDAQTFTPSDAGVDVVTALTDGNVFSTNSGGGNPGELRYVMRHAAAGDTIVFDTQAMCGEPSCTIVLSGPLPPIVLDLTIDGGAYGRITIDGDGKFRIFLAETGAFKVANLEIAHGLSRGGHGGAGYAGGGGGAGLGGGILVVEAAVTVVNCYFYQDGAIGGAGGNGIGTSGGGGGGGGLGGWLDADGGSASSLGAGGGGGMFGPGESTTTNNGGDGGPGDGVAAATGGTAGDNCGTPCVYSYFPSGSNGSYGGGGSGGAPDLGTPFDTGSRAYEGGSGGWGGGGGGGGGRVTVEPDPDNPSFNGSGMGGDGGYGGGGGGIGSDLSPTPNGPFDPKADGHGGGGGAGHPGYGGLGLGGLVSGLPAPRSAGDSSLDLAGGDGAQTAVGVAAPGGGGAAGGPAIFVDGGYVTVTNSGAFGSYATPGSGGIGGGVRGGDGQADATPVYEFNAPLPDALTTTAPTVWLPSLVQATSKRTRSS